jgi:hypothetical protein
MQRFLWIALLALPLCVQPARAQFCCNCNPCCLPTVCSSCPCPCLANIAACMMMEAQPRGPWYLGFPTDTGYIAPGTSFVPVMPLVGHMDFAGPLPSVGRATPPRGQMQPASFQPVSYSYPAVAPSYWYGR